MVVLVVSFYEIDMNPQLDVITLGVSDLERSTRFYGDGLGLPIELTDENYVRFATGETQLALFPRDLLANDGNVAPEGSGFSGITLAQVVASKEELEDILNVAESAGGEITKPAEEAEWFNGFSGYFSDPDGYLWEIVVFE